MPKLIIEITETHEPDPADSSKFTAGLSCECRIEFSKGEHMPDALLPHLVPVFQAAIAAAIKYSKGDHGLFEIQSVTPGPMPERPAEPAAEDFPAEI